MKHAKVFITEPRNIFKMKYEGTTISWRKFFDLNLPITNDVKEQASNWRVCPLGERLYESLSSGTSIPNLVTKKVRKLSRNFAKQINAGNWHKARQSYYSIRKEKQVLEKKMIWIRELPTTSI